jgi:hypothetical protein
MAGAWITGLTSFGIPTNVIEKSEDRKIVERKTPMAIAESAF